MQSSHSEGGFRDFELVMDFIKMCTVLKETDLDLKTSVVQRSLKMFLSTNSFVSKKKKMRNILCNLEKSHLALVWSPLGLTDHWASSDFVVLTLTRPPRSPQGSSA